MYWSYVQLDVSWTWKSRGRPARYSPAVLYQWSGLRQSECADHTYSRLSWAWKSWQRLARYSSAALHGLHWHGYCMFCSHLHWHTFLRIYCTAHICVMLTWKCDFKGRLSQDYLPLFDHMPCQLQCQENCEWWTRSEPVICLQVSLSHTASNPRQHQIPDSIKSLSASNPREHQIPDSLCCLKKSVVVIVWEWWECTLQSGRLTVISNHCGIPWLGNSTVCFVATGMPEMDIQPVAEFHKCLFLFF